jgi:hypothetical protein
MRNKPNVLVPILVLAGIGGFSPAMAGGSYTDAPSRDIDMCIAEVRARADFTEAARVRYDVSTTRRSVGYAIGIRTRHGLGARGFGGDVLLLGDGAAHARFSLKCASG